MTGHPLRRGDVRNSCRLLAAGGGKGPPKTSKTLSSQAPLARPVRPSRGRRATMSKQDIGRWPQLPGVRWPPLRTMNQKRPVGSSLKGSHFRLLALSVCTISSHRLHVLNPVGRRGGAGRRDGEERRRIDDWQKRSMAAGASGQGAPGSDEPRLESLWRGLQGRPLRRTTAARMAVRMAAGGRLKDRRRRCGRGGHRRPGGRGKQSDCPLLVPGATKPSPPGFRGEDRPTIISSQSASTAVPSGGIGPVSSSRGYRRCPSAPFP